MNEKMLLDRNKLSTDQKELLEAAEPLIEYLCKNHHPHVKVIVDGTSVELLEGLMSIPKIYDHIED